MGNGKLKPHPTFPFYVFPPTPTPENNKAIKDNKDTKGEIVKRTTPKNKISILATSALLMISYAPFFQPLQSTTTARAFRVHDRAFGHYRYFGTIIDTLSVTPINLQ